MVEELLCPNVPDAHREERERGTKKERDRVKGVPAVGAYHFLLNTATPAPVSKI